MKILENDFVKRTDCEEYGIVVGYWRDRQTREQISVKFITSDNKYTYGKTYTIKDGVPPEEIVFTDKDEEKYSLLMASGFED